MSLRRWKRTIPKLLGRIRLALAGLWRGFRATWRWLKKRRRGLKLLLLALLLGLGALALRAYDPVRRAARNLAQARILQEAHQPEAALPYLHEAAALQPQEARYALEEAAALDALQRYDQAEDALRQALTRLPDDPGLLAAIGQVLLRRGRTAEAAAILVPLAPRIRSHPDAGFACQALTATAEVLALRGELLPAERMLKDALARRSPLGSPATWALREHARLGLAQVLLFQRRASEAEAALRQGLKEVPGSAGLRLALARLLSTTGRSEESALLLEALVADAAPPLRVDAAVAAVDLRIRLGQGERALEVAHALPASEARVVVTYGRGVIALARGEPAPARAAFQELAGLLPSSARPLLLEAQAALQASDLRAAHELLLKALEKDPNGREAQRALLELEERQGDLAAVRARAAALLEDPVLRALAVKTLFALHAREDDARGGLQRLEALAQRYPDDLTVRAYAAVFGILSGQVQAGVQELSRLAGQGGLPAAFSLLASAREGTSDSLEAIELLAGLAEREVSFAPARLVLAQIYERLGRLDLATREVDAALAHDPSDTTARFERARLALQVEDVPRALGELEALRAAGVPPERLLALLDLLADRLLASARDPRPDEVDLARRLLLEAARLAPGEARPEARLGRVLLLQGSLTPAREAFARALAVGPELVGAHGGAAVDLLEGKIEAATAALRAALSATGDPRFGAALAAATALSGNPAGAAEALLPWLSVAGEAPEARVFQGMLLALAAQPGPAEAVLQGVPLPAPVREGALHPAARPEELREVLEQLALFCLGLLPEARQRSARAVSSDVGVLQVWWALRPLRQGGDPRLRVQLARRLMDACPADRQAALELSEALIAAGEFEPARALLAEIAAEGKTPDPELETRLGQLSQQLGRTDEARAAYERALKSPVPPLVALNNLANLLADDPARRAEALGYARKAWERAADRSETWDTLGWLLFLSGQAEEAEAHLAWAATLAPGNPTIRYHLARVLVARGKSRRAKNHLQLAVLLGRQFAEEEAAQAMLRELHQNREGGE